MATSAALGAFIGYFTNALAIKALFRPLRPRWYSLGWQGVIPKNRARLADNMARVVGEDLLYRDYLLEQIERPALQENLRAYLHSWGRRLLGVTPAEVFARLPETWRERSLLHLLERALSLLADWSQSETGRVFAREVATEWVDGGEIRVMIGTMFLRQYLIVPKLNLKLLLMMSRLFVMDLLWIW